MRPDVAKKYRMFFLPKNRPHPQVAACGWKSVKRCTAKQSKSTSKCGSLQVGVKPTWRLCLMSWATSLFSGSFSRPMTKWTRPEVFLKTEAAYACVTPTRLAESTWVSKMFFARMGMGRPHYTACIVIVQLGGLTSIIWSLTLILPSLSAAPLGVIVLMKMPSFSKPASAPTPMPAYGQ